MSLKQMKDIEKEMDIQMSKMLQREMSEDL